MLSRLLSNFRANGLLGTLLPLTPNRAALFLYRAAAALNRAHIPELPYLLHYCNALLFGCEIHYKATVGKNFTVLHSQGIVVGRKVVIGSDVRIYSGVVIGKKDKNTGMPVIGNRVLIGSGAKLLGDIRVGNNVIIAANAVVISDIPDNSVVAGSPARVVKTL